MNSVELKDAIHNAVVECRSIVDSCKTELRELTEDEKNRIDELKSIINEKKHELKALEEELNTVFAEWEKLSEEEIASQS